jgi:hypothetical protein
MAAARKYFNIDDKPEIIDLAADVRDAHGPVVLRLAGVDVAYVGPISTRSEQETDRNTLADTKAALMNLAGAWADMDTDTLVEEIYERRSNSSRRSLNW